MGDRMVKPLLVAFFLMALFPQSYSKQDSTRQDSSNEEGHMTIQKVQEKYTDSLMAIPGVLGVGIGKEDSVDCIVIFVDSLTKELKKKLPKELENYPVKVEQTGEFRKFPEK